MHTSTKQYYKVKYRSGDNPHWYDDRDETWSLDDARQKKNDVIDMLSGKDNVEVKIVVRTEIKHTHDVEIDY